MAQHDGCSLEKAVGSEALRPDQTWSLALLLLACDPPFPQLRHHRPPKACVSEGAEGDEAGWPLSKGIRGGLEVEGSDPGGWPGLGCGKLPWRCRLLALCPRVSHPEIQSPGRRKAAPVARTSPRPHGGKGSSHASGQDSTAAAGLCCRALHTWRAPGAPWALSTDPADLIRPGWGQW